MRTRVTTQSWTAVLALVLVTTSFMVASPTVQASTPDATGKVALTGSTINSNVTVGVKSGDWMEYKVTYGGDGDPPENYPTLFRYDITNVQGTSITATITYESINGVISNVTNTYNLKTGVLNLLVVPAGLTYADVFYHEQYGNITIAGTEDGTYLDVKRTAFHATFDNITVYWDKTTGIFLKSEQEFLNYDNQTVTQQVQISATNLWFDPNSVDNSELDQIVFYAKVVAVVLVAVIAVVLLTRLRKRGK